MSFTLSSNTGEGESTEWLVPDMVMQFKFNLFDGRGESGKSSVVSKIIGDWHNRKDLAPNRRLKKVLWLSEEEDFNSEIKPRLQLYGLRTDQIVTIDYASGKCPRPILPEQIQKFTETLKSNGVNCVVLDPFTETKPGDWKIIDNEAMRTYIGGLDRVCRQTAVTMFGMRHMTKATNTHSSDDGQGCSAIRDTSRCVLRVDKTEDRHRRFFLTVQKCNRAKPTMPLEFTFEQGEGEFVPVKWLGHKDMTIDEIKKLSESKVHRSQLDEAKRLLCAALKDGEKSCKGLIQEAKDYGIGERTLMQAKADLGVISTRKTDETTGNGHWVWSMPADAPSIGQTIGGESEVQQTMLDLPEYAAAPPKMYEQPPEPTANAPAEPTPAPKPKRVRKKKAVAEAKPKPKVAAKGKGKAREAAK